jgi:hypothetical protein
MLRDVLCQFEGVATWPCDEINYIWRHGNVGYPSDEIPAENASPAIKQYIRKKFEWVATKYDVHTVVEKTCANSLRVPFVDKVIPEAKYVYIYRDGLDTAGSASLRWKAGLDIPYLMEKTRFVPLVDLPYYAFRYISSHVYRLFSKEQRVAFWGPALQDMQAILENHSLYEVCALQWQRCVENAETAFAAIEPERVIRVSYEQFVEQPEQELKRILDFVGIKATNNAITESVANVSSKNIGKGRARLSLAERQRIESLVGTTLRRYGYIE